MSLKLSLFNYKYMNELTVFLLEKKNSSYEKKCLMLLCAIVFIVFFSCFITSKENKLTEFTHGNIEALASGEAGGDVYCIGIGSLDCNGHKVLRIYSPLKIKYNQ